MAIAAHAGAFCAAVVIALGGPIDVVGDRQVEPSVVVVIKPGGAGSPSTGIRHAGLLGDIGEGAVAVIVVEDRAAISQHHQVGIPVVIVIAHRHSHSEQALGAYVSDGRHVGEGAVSIV